MVYPNEKIYKNMTEQEKKKALDIVSKIDSKLDEYEKQVSSFEEKYKWSATDAFLNHCGYYTEEHRYNDNLFFHAWPCGSGTKTCSYPASFYYSEVDLDAIGEMRALREEMRDFVEMSEMTWDQHTAFNVLIEALNGYTTNSYPQQIIILEKTRICWY
ncbi:MAG: hypothetical protein GY756_14365 [bacterium]|nr:hypothetical protein [bacterium]